MKNFDFTAFDEALAEAGERNGLGAWLPPAAREKLAALTDLLIEENKLYNLTAITEPRAAILRHLLDCLPAARFLPENATVLDVGCGAGFPTLPLAICRPDLRLTALDATAKKIAFVEKTAAALELTNVTPLCGRAEEVAHGKARASFDCVTARAVSELRLLAELCLPFVRPGGRFVAMKARGADEELAAAGNALHTLGAEADSRADFTLTDGKETLSRTVLVFRRTGETPALYPRPWGKMLKKPL